MGQISLPPTFFSLTLSITFAQRQSVLLSFASACRHSVCRVNTYRRSSTCPRRQRVEEEEDERKFIFHSTRGKSSEKRSLVLSSGASPADSGTIESVFFDEPTAQQITVHELSTPETVKLDLLLQTKTLSEKVTGRHCRWRGSMGLSRR